jgi:hypothetical protein
MWYKNREESGVIYNRLMIADSVPKLSVVIFSLLLAIFHTYSTKHIDYSQKPHIL